MSIASTTVVFDKRPVRYVLRFCALVATVCLCPAWTHADAVATDHAEQMAKSLDLFTHGVGDLIVQNCVKCHGGDKTEGELDLTTRDGLVKGGEQGPAVIVGRPGESLLVKLIRHEAEPGMPLEGDRLSDEAIERISAWIASGAAYDKPLVDAGAAMKARRVTDQERHFWSFQPLAPGPVPAVREQSWCRGPIDQFVLAGLEAKGIEPNGAAARRTLIRRAYFDLIGLPPDAAEVEAFVNDPATDAYDRLVDRLLASSHYGERWARHWLDLARFAESHGYEQDYDRPSAYHYRDFVIQALNEDMPYDRFVKLQIAGDEYEPDNRLALMATGFLGCGTHATQITANQVEKERYDELDDMAATVGTAMLGLTIGCARCHDHKFDPIPQADYYRLVSTFTTTVRSEIELDFHPEVYREAKAQFEREHAPLQKALHDFERDELPGRVDAWLAKNVPPVAAKWLILEAEGLKSDGGATLERLEDGSYLLGGTNAPHDVYTFSMQTKAKGITAVRIEALADGSLPGGGPGRANNGNFALSDFQIWAAPTGTPAPGAPVKLGVPKATFEQSSLPVAAAIDDNQTTAWGIDPEVGKNQAASFELETPLPNPQGTTLTFILKFENNSGFNLGRLRLGLTTAAKPVGLEGDAASERTLDEVNQALLVPPPERKVSEPLVSWFRAHDADWQRLDAAVRDHARQAPKPKLTKVLIASEGLPAVRLHTQGADYFDKTYFLKRGDLNQKVGEAEQGFLQVLTSAPDGEKHWQITPPEGSRTSFRRHALADWITDPQAGAGVLLARVIVNRLWQHHFGHGLVATPNDFGSAGARPTHAELLDYLAGQLVAGGWRLKSLHKQIMTSAAYMESTDVDARRAALDPDNLLLWHRARQRLEAETIRDAMLAVGGQLDERMFGPGSLDESHRRRSIYFTVKRSQLVSGMVLFDAPDSLQGLGQRASTIVAPQALAMLNSPSVVACARGFAQRLRSVGEISPAQMVGRAYLLALARPADQQETFLATSFVEQATAAYQSEGKSDAAELAWADFCQVLLGLNEFIYIE